jgi:hypothetical protein
MIRRLLYATATRPAMVATQSPKQWLLGSLSPGVKGPGREADHLSPSSGEVKMHAGILRFPVCLYDVALNYARGQLYVYLLHDSTKNLTLHVLGPELVLKRLSSSRSRFRIWCAFVANHPIPRSDIPRLSVMFLRSFAHQ